jgi:hypothetical protein
VPVEPGVYRSKHTLACLSALSQGYFVNGRGVVIGKRGKALKTHRDDCFRRRITIRVDGRARSISVDKLLQVQKWVDNK